MVMFVTPVGVDFATTFNECRAVPDANSLYKALFAEHGARADLAVYMDLSEAHRRSLERLSVEVRESADRSRTSSDVRNRAVRNWAMRQGIGLAPKGRVPESVKNAYRIAHDMPVVDSKPPKSTLPPIDANPSEIRSWARSTGLEVGSRGRIDTDILRQYLEAHTS
jgi:hypothetical protein